MPADTPNGAVAAPGPNLWRHLRGPGAILARVAATAPREPLSLLGIHAITFLLFHLNLQLFFMADTYLFLRDKLVLGYITTTLSWRMVNLAPVFFHLLWAWHTPRLRLANILLALISFYFAYGYWYPVLSGILSFLGQIEPMAWFWSFRHVDVMLFPDFIGNVPR